MQQRGVTLIKLKVSPPMRDAHTSRLRNEQREGIVAVLDQILVAKREPRAERGSRNRQRIKLKLEGSAEWHARQRLEINIAQRPRKLLAPFVQQVVLCGHATPITIRCQVSTLCARPNESTDGRCVCNSPTDKSASSCGNPRQKNPRLLALRRPHRQHQNRAHFRCTDHPRPV